MAKTKTDDAPAEERMTDAELKSWVRRELHLAANGVSEAEREVANP